MRRDAIRQGTAKRGGPWAAWLLPLWLTGLVLTSGCQRSQPELLVVYSGDGQAHIEPCG